MYLTRDQLRKLRGIIYSRVSGGFEYYMCCQIIDSYLSLYDVDMKVGDKFYPNVYFAKNDLGYAIDFIIRHYKVRIADL